MRIITFIVICLFTALTVASASIQNDGSIHTENVSFAESSSDSLASSIIFQGNGITPETHLKRIFEDQNGVIFINSYLPYQFLLRLATEPEASDSLSFSEILNPEDKLSHGIQIPEGPARFTLETADGGILQRTIVSDGTPPAVELFKHGALFRNDSHSDVPFLGPPALISLEATDEASGVLEIYASVNGAPFQPHRIALEQIQTEGLYEIAYYAADRVGNTSEIEFTSFIRDLTPPEAELTVAGPNFDYFVSPESEIIFEIFDDGSGPNDLRYRIASLSDLFSTYVVPIGLSDVPDGEFKIEFIATDKTGATTDTLSKVLFLDSKPPQIRSLVGEPNFIRDNTKYVAESTSISFESADEHSGLYNIQYQIDEQEFQDYENAFILSGESNLYTISFFAEDKVGNRSEIEQIRLFLDNNPPVADYYFNGSYALDGSEYTITSQTSLHIEADDFETLYTEIFYTIRELSETSNNSETTSAEELEEIQYTEPIQISDPGKYKLSFYVLDGVGNKSESEKVIITIDDDSEGLAEFRRTEPTSTEFRAVRDDEGNLYVPGNEPVFIYLSTSPDESAPQYLLFGSEDQQPFSGYMLPGEQNQVLRLAIQDSVSYFTVVADKRAPITGLEIYNSPRVARQDTLIFNNSVSINLTSTDDITGVSEIKYSIDGSGFLPYSQPLSGFLAQKMYSILYFAEDRVGNREEEQSFRFWVDATPPRTRLELISNFSGSILSPKSEIRLVATDNLAGVEQTYFSFNTSENMRAYEGEITLGEYSDELHTDATNRIYFYSIDKVSNKEQLRVFNFRYQVRKPELSYNWSGAFVRRANGYVVNPQSRLQLQAVSGNVPMRSLTYNFNGTTDNYNQPIQFEAGQAGTVRFALEDQLGNTSEPLSLQVISDAQPPRTTHRFEGPRIEYRGNQILGPDHQIILQATDNAAGVSITQVEINNLRPQRYTQPLRIPQSGAYRIEYYSTDGVGNREEKRSFEILADLTPPEVSLLLSPLPVRTSSGGIEVIQPQTFIVLNAVDQMTDVQTLTYRIDDGEEQTYFTPLRGFRAGETFTLTVTATDLVGNSRTIERRFLVE
ncbi:MAG: hypothetical protein LAT67_11735 [Balneolales bacterium]|nr:hypothetical protein [Balneolales bacterium]